MSDGCKVPAFASPGWPGKLKFKCILWPNCPLYERIRQDQTFIFSPETLTYAPQKLRDKIVSIAGVDGGFLRPRPNFYLHNFLCFLKRGEYQFQPGEKENINSPYFKNIPSLPNLEFLGLEDALTANELVLEGNSAVSSSAMASHQTWLADGSLYCTDNVLPSEYGSSLVSRGINNTARAVREYFCTGWEYITQKVSNPVGTNGSSVLTTNETKLTSVHMPSVTGIASSDDPVQVMKDNNIEDVFKVSGSENTYRNINPGLHWRVVKRTPLFQGEDFVIEFRKTATEGVSSVSSTAKFRMLDRFKYLDVYTFNQQLLCGSLNNEGFIDFDKKQQIIEDTRKVFDFSRQIYYMIEIGKDDPDHHYLIIIAENSFPIFCHIGKTPYLRCTLSFTGSNSNPPPAPSRDASSPRDCAESTDQAKPGASTDNGRLGEFLVVENPEDLVLRKLGTYDGASSLTLLKQDKLRVSIRQHGGNMIVTFSGHEDNPWVVSRKDLDPNSTPSGQPVTESQVAYNVIRMQIPEAQIAIMGGNIKTAFSFVPQLYDRIDNYTMPQPFSIGGPVNVDEVQFLWRDKAISQNPEVSINQTKKWHYTNEAGEYIEIAVDDGRGTPVGISSSGSFERTAAKPVQILATEVQPEWVFKYGKAPDMVDSQEARKNGIQPSALIVNASECTTSAGSVANTSKLMQASISVVPGGYLFYAIDGGEPWALQGCVTPIVYNLRLYVPPKGCVFNKSPIDVSQHVLTFSDEWSETDFQKLEHQGSISFLISQGMKFPNNQSNYLSQLNGRAFYLQISMWWEDGIMPRPIDEQDKIIFTGFCAGGVIATETNKKILECKLCDYSKILKDQMFFNSPYFDRMRDVNAIREILQLSGLRDGEDNQSTFEPGSLVRILADSDPKDEWYTLFFNGEKLITREFALPGSYDILQSPFLRFTDGQPYWDAIEKIALLANKVAYFDRFGVFNFTALPYDQELFGGQQGSETNWDVQDWGELSKADFFATPKGALNSDGMQLNRQIVGDYKVERIVSDVVNEIKVISTSPNGEILIAGHVNYASLHDPDSPGFLGYRKPFLQMDGIFGSEANVKWMVKNYTRMFIPPLRVTFRAIGRNNIKALDVITFQPLGSREKQPLIVSSIKSEVNAENGTWFQDFECLWLYPRQNVDWGSTNEVGMGLDGSISGNNVGG